MFYSKQIKSKTYSAFVTRSQNLQPFIQYFVNYLIWEVHFKRSNVVKEIKCWFIFVKVKSLHCKCKPSLTQLCFLVFTYSINFSFVILLVSFVQDEIRTIKPFYLFFLTEDGRVKYKVCFEEKGKSLVSGHHVALDNPPKLDELYVGARVVIQSSDDESSFQPGILAELPSRKNRLRFVSKWTVVHDLFITAAQFCCFDVCFHISLGNKSEHFTKMLIVCILRFLIFLDDHSVLYVSLPSLHLVCRPRKFGKDLLSHKYITINKQRFLSSLAYIINVWLSVWCFDSKTSVFITSD